jgi:Repeat of unknown function (DUF5648)
MKSTFARMLMISLALAAAVLWSSQIAPSSSASLVPQQNCSFTVSPGSFSFPTGGGSGTIFVNIAQGCNWTASSNDFFIFVNNPNQQFGSVNFSVAGNIGPPRNGTITVSAGFTTRTVFVSQQGVPTRSFYRYWNGGIYNHYYTIDFSELGNGANGYVFEHVEGHVYDSQISGTVPLKRYFCADNGDHFYTTNPSEPGAGLPCYQFERIEAYVFPNQVSGTIPLYRYYEPNAQDHFYTTNFNELGTGKLGWYLEGVQCYVLP